MIEVLSKGTPPPPPPPVEFTCSHCNSVLRCELSDFSTVTFSTYGIPVRGGKFKIDSGTLTCPVCDGGATWSVSLPPAAPLTPEERTVMRQARLSATRRLLSGLFFWGKHP
jgi:hypothetical protein